MTEASPRAARHLRKAGLWILLLTCLIFCAWAGWRMIATRGSKQAEGVYLLDGARGALSIRATRFGGLRVDGGYFHWANEISKSEAPLQARFYFGKLIIDQSPDVRWGDNSKYNVNWRMTLQPSADFAEWSLLDLEMNYQSAKDFSDFTGNMKDLASAVWAWSVRSGNFYEVTDAWRTLWRKEEERRTIQLDPAKLPLPRFMVRAKDPVVLDLIDRLRRAPDTDRGREEGLKTARRLDAFRADHPGVIINTIVHEANHGDLEKAEKRMREWENRPPSGEDALLRHYEIFAQLVLHRARFRKSRPDSPLFEELFPGEKTALRMTADNKGEQPPWQWSLERKLEWAGGLMDSEWTPFLPVDYVANYARMHSRIDLPKRENPQPIDEDLFFGGSILEKMIHLRLVAGRRGEALELLKRALLSIWIVNLSHESSPLDADQNIQLLGHILHHLSETPEDAAEIWGMIDELERHPAFKLGEFGLIHEHPFLRADGFAAPENALGPNNSRDLVEMIARLRLVQCAAAAIHFSLKTGTYPASDADFTLFGEKGLPEDPFFPGERLRWTSRPDGFAVYSAGENRKDDGGTEDHLDLIHLIPTVKAVVLPREPVEADTWEDLKTIYPDGIPSRFWEPVGWKWNDAVVVVIDSTTTRPTLLALTDINRRGGLSRGFAAFGSQRIEKDEYYDGSPFPPTGLLGALVGALTGPPPPLIGTQVYRRAIVQADDLSSASTVGAYGPLVSYDPTNGTDSPGDLFLELPKKRQ